MADIQLREQFSNAPDLSIGRDFADYDVWVREQFPGAPDLSCYPTQLGIRQPAAGGHAAISGVIGITLEGLTPQFIGTVTHSIHGVLGITLDGLVAQFAGTVTGGTTAGPSADGARLRRGKRRLPEDIRREQDMVEKYLQALEQRARHEETVRRTPARVKKAAVSPDQPVPTLTEAMARAASVEQLRRIEEHAQSVGRAREVVRAESRRRRRLALILIAMDD